MYPEEYRYTKEHEWINKENGTARIGITDYAQKELGDIVYVDLPAAGKKFNSGDPFGSIESVKAVSEIYAPVGMEIVDINKEVMDQPELINQDPHKKGWLLTVRILRAEDLDQLLSAGDYEKLISEGKH